MLTYATFKKDAKIDKENYRLNSIFPNLIKVYERFMYNQMCPFFDQIFSKLQCGFPEGFKAEQCLIDMIEKWQKYLDTDGHSSIKGKKRISKQLFQENKVAKFSEK